MLKQFSDLQGKIIKNIEINEEKDCIIFTIINDDKYKLYHSGDCCESVTIEDITGDLANLINTRIIIAEEVERSGDEIEKEDSEYREDDSYTWTFYKLSTIKGYVTIRWYGSSNGYYSESVSFEKCKDKK